MVTSCKTMVQFHNEETDIDTIHILFTCPQFYLYPFVCVYVFISMWKLFFFFQYIFNQKDIRPHLCFCFWKEEIEILATEIRIHPGVCCFPVIAWKCSIPLHTEQSANTENKGPFWWVSVLVFYTKILYVKRAGFSVISPHPCPLLCQSCSQLSF